MRAKVAKILRKIAYGPEGSLKAPREYKGGWMKFKVRDKEGKIRVKWVWNPLTNTGARARYLALKRQYRDHGKAL